MTETWQDPAINVEHEGFSFLYAPTASIFPDLQGHQAFGDSTSKSPASLATLTFSTKGSTTRLTLPLANTLFKTGEPSMLLVTKWEQVPKGSFKKLAGPDSRQNVLLSILRNRGRKMSPMYFPTVALTPARKIVSGLGNIVRRLEYSNRRVGSASEELEVSVNDALKIDTRATVMGVWALIIPHQATLYNREARSRMLDMMQYPKHEEPKSVDQWSAYVRHWILHGANLCRVCKY